MPAILLSLVLGIPSAALAYWTAGGGGTGGGTSGSLLAPIATATRTAGTNTIVISWALPAASGNPTSFHVQRAPSGGAVWTDVCGTNAAPITGPSCSNSPSTTGDWKYRVIAHKGSWRATSNETTAVATDFVRPTVTINQASGQADPTRVQPINFTIKFSEPVVNFAASMVALTLGGQTASGTRQLTVVDPTTYTLAVSGLTADFLPLVATIPTAAVRDESGNTNVASVSTDNSVTLDSVIPGAPVAPILAVGSDSGTSNSDRITNVVTPEFTGTVPASEAGSTVTLRRWTGASGGTPTVVGTVAVAATGAYSITSTTTPTSSAADGIVYYYSVSVTDRAGNIGPESPRTSMTLDTTAPAPVITNAYTSGLLGTTLNVAGSRGTTPGDLGVANPSGALTLTFCGSATFPCASPLATDTVTGTASSWTFSRGALLTGSLLAVHIRATQTDVAGNVGASNVFRLGLL